MKKIAIYGAGGFGREIALMIAQINEHTPQWELIGFFDDKRDVNSKVDGLPVLGGMATLNSFPSPLSVCMAIADPHRRSSIHRQIINSTIDFPILIHPSANCGDSARNSIGVGSIITAGVILTTGISLGEFCIVNLASTIGHDVGIGSFNTVMPGCSISGNVTIGKNCMIGTGARIIQAISIGDDCIVGAGSVVTKSFESGLKLLGVPARKRTNHVEGI